MTSADFLRYTVGIAIWALIALSVYVAVNFVRFLDHLKKSISTMVSAAATVAIVRSGFRLGVFNVLQKIILMLRGGDGSGQKQ